MLQEKFLDIKQKSQQMLNCIIDMQNMINLSMILKNQEMLHTA